MISTLWHKSKFNFKIFDKAKVISFLGVQTDRVLECGNRFAQKKKFNSKLKISSQMSIPICLPGGRGCIKTPHTTRAAHHTFCHTREVNIHWSSFPYFSYSPVTSKQTPVPSCLCPTCSHPYNKRGGSIECSS